MSRIGSFFTNEEGQDLAEYALLIAWIALGTAALFMSSGQSISGMWTSASSQLRATNESLGQGGFVGAP